ncbi:hypothetical protein L3N51_00643 [Metallosphaera sp. J1]|uniref:hypothetical protein n=1 Tax=Metallosphaera TaxID=41980 RepID=UPI001EDF2ABD|nr:hypothetical protein [Metallosphaera javensis (ex Hofmann et al. 2022)]MCG3108362.1 hypothetical protein [Metallosphaera javensis (ex Hofmann et al. 2022)]BCS92751.1 MAG: hypothetical protein MjAS7_1359 [Metallosphaera javensis (ex Sakai et al. 2022)]
MKVKIKAIANLSGHERLAVIPLAVHGKYLLGLNFYEDVEGGRLARFVLVEDKYGEVNDVRVVEGDKVIVRAEGVREDMERLSKVIRVERTRVTENIPLILNPRVESRIEGEERGVRGYLNYVNRYGKPDLRKLEGVISLSVEEILEG